MSRFVAAAESGTTGYPSATRAPTVRRPRSVLDLSWRGMLPADAAGERVLPLREAVRRDAVIALGSLAGSLVDRHPRETLDLLERRTDQR